MGLSPDQEESYLIQLEHEAGQTKYSSFHYAMSFECLCFLPQATSDLTFVVYAYDFAGNRTQTGNVTITYVPNSGSPPACYGKDNNSGEGFTPFDIPSTCEKCEEKLNLGPGSCSTCRG